MADRVGLRDDQWQFGPQSAGHTPVVPGAAMAFSSVFVVTSSLRLRGFRSIR